MSSNKNLITYINQGECVKMAKITKPQLVERILKVRNNIDLEKDVMEFIDYNVKKYEENNRNLTMEDLKDIIAYIEEVTGEDFNKLLLETESEPTVETTTEEDDAVEHIVNLVTPVVKEETEKKKLVPKKEDKVKPQPKEEPKAESKKVLKPVHDTIQMLASFPQTLESTVLKAKLKLRSDLKNAQDVVNAYNNEEDIIIATYWTKRHLKQYAGSYDPMNINPNKPKEFEHDLDLIEITYANDLVVTGCSLYSYVPQIFLPKDFTLEEDGMRYANGCEFQIYEIIEG